jgi:hypothetical protein
MTTDMRSLTDAEINEVTGGCTEDAVPTETWTLAYTRFAPADPTVHGPGPNSFSFGESQEMRESN